MRAGPNSAIVEHVKKLEGLSASPGIVVGPVYFLPEEETLVVPRHEVAESELDEQWERFTAALERSRHELTLLRDDQNREHTDILDAHLMMLSDPEFIPQIEKHLRSRHINIEAALKDKVDEAVSILRSTGDDYLAERAVDIEDAFGRVLGHLLGSATAGRFVPPGTILVARNMKPSQAMTLKDSGILGIVMEEGGATSHVAILARTWQLPAVMGVRGIFDDLDEDSQIILDAEAGHVICDPPFDLLQAYRTRTMDDQVRRTERENERRFFRKARCMTRDKIAVTVRANIALPEEAKPAREEGAEGIGLFRSEFLFLGADSEPDEEAQYTAYRTAAQAMNGEPVIIRTLDAGGDKMLADQVSLAELNPLLGWRAVRYCLDRRELFQTQLRALVRASAHGDVRIMFPMISGPEELEEALKALEEAKAECARQGRSFNRKLKVGAMIEIPSAAVCADLLARKVDFLSIGTNDLIQYSLAVDRENSRVAHLYEPYHPAVLRLIRQTIEAGIRHRVEVSICGEMGGDPAAVVLLLGMGLRSFSMAPSLIAPVKKMVLSVTMAEAAELADHALSLGSAREIRKLIEEKLKAYA